VVSDVFKCSANLTKGLPRDPHPFPFRDQGCRSIPRRHLRRHSPLLAIRRHRSVQLSTRPPLLLRRDRSRRLDHRTKDGNTARRRDRVTAATAQPNPQTKLSGASQSQPVASSTAPRMGSPTTEPADLADLADLEGSAVLDAVCTFLARFVAYPSCTPDMHTPCGWRTHGR
jgi:hypothetical protein